MNKVTLFDTNFSHAYSRNNGDLKILPKKVIFDRNNLHNTIFYTDYFIKQNYASKFKGHKNVAWILEPKSIDGYSYESVLNNLNLYDFVISHDRKFIEIVNSLNSRKGLLCDVGGTWIEENDWQIYEKQYNLSIIASSKNITKGHKLRHEIISKNVKCFDCISGRGYSPINYKLESLKDYRFSVIIENEIDTFTEKLIDCLVTGTVPIYYGTNHIKDIFDMNSILCIENETDFNNIFKDCNDKFYNSKIESIKNNFNLALNYTNTEDLIYNKYCDILFL